MRQVTAPTRGLAPSPIRRRLAALTVCGIPRRLPGGRSFGYKVALQSAWSFMTCTRSVTTVALAMALPFTAPADETRAVDLAAIGQQIKSNVERLQQYASTVQQSQAQLGQLHQQLHQQLLDATRPGLELCAKAQQTWQGLQQVQRIFQNGSLLLQQLSALDYYRAHVSSAQYQPLPGEASHAESRSAVHLQSHH